jgi:LemA protein
LASGHYFLIGIAILGTAVLVWLIVTYNRLIRQNNRLREGWSGIDVQLKRRRDLIPNLVECVKAYRDHERDLLEAVTRHWADAAMAIGASAAQKPENAISLDQGRLLALARRAPLPHRP